MISVLFAVQVVLGAFLIWKAAGYRVVATVLIVTQLWMAKFVAAVAGMAVTGDWI